jgi:hypothetical protein
MWVALVQMLTEALKRQWLVMGLGVRQTQGVGACKAEGAHQP